MDELHVLSADVARSFLAEHFEPIDERSRLFEDLQQLALDALVTVRTGERAVKIKPPGETRGYWREMRPAA